jgi:hypothetical protein
MEGGRIRFSGLASELREKPELLQSAYLLRGRNGEAGSPAQTPTSASAGTQPRQA